MPRQRRTRLLAVTRITREIGMANGIPATSLSTTATRSTYGIWTATSALACRVALSARRRRWSAAAKSRPAAAGGARSR
jgi:hypothetical protein